jgi:RNA polymerase sigma-70 factor (ECF subfamily)
MEQSDKALMLAAKSGDAEQFGVLFDRHHQRLFDFFYRLGSDAASSEDLVQDVFLRMLKYRNTFRADSEFRAWMYGIARTVRIDRFRGQRVESPLTDDGAPIADSNKDSSGGPLRHLQEQERAALLQRALLRLPEAKRELLILARFHELKYEQIGNLLDVDVGTVKVRVHRAMVELREIVRRMSGESAPCVVKKSG